MAVLSGNVSVVAAEVTIYVDDDNTGGPWDGTLAHPYQYIQDGINAASEGDTVHVLGGTYVENVVANKSVRLEGESKPVINGMTGHGIDVFANNVTIEGFNITYSGYCIYTNASGFSIRNNVFWHEFDYDFYGVYWGISESSLAEDYTIHASRIENNEFYMSGIYDAIYVDVMLNYGSNSGYDVEIGDIQICNNMFNMEETDASGIVVEKIVVQSLYGGTASFGVLNMSGNTMYGGMSGIYFHGALSDLKDVQASVDDVIINNNVLVNQSSYGMGVDYYYGISLNGNTVSTYGDLIIRGNTIISEIYDPGGIYLIIGYWRDFYDYASLEVGNVYIEENEIDVGGSGIYLYGYEAGYNLQDNSSFTMGHILVRDNNINSGYEGIDVYLEYFGSDMAGNASFTMGNIELSGNVINSASYGIYLGHIIQFGYEMDENSSFSMGSILVNNNTITSYDGIYVDNIMYFGEYVQDNSSFTMGNIEFSGNIINSTNYGICAIDLAYEFGCNMTGDSSFTMGHIQVNDNSISSGYDGIYVEYVEYFGTDMYGSSSFVMGNIEVSGNTINSTNYGIWLYEIDYLGYRMYDDSSFAMGDFLVNNNVVNSAGDGMYLEYIEYFGYFMYGNSSFTMGNVRISGNVVNSAQRGIFIEDLYEFGANMHGTSSFTMSDIEVSGNRINSTLEGIYIQSFYHAYYMFNNASFAIEDVFVNDNIINSKDSGIVLRQIFPYTRFGYNARENATIITGNVEFCKNEIVASNSGLDLADFENATIINNTMQNCSLGIYLQDSANNSIYHNNFINNTQQAYVRALYTSTPYCNNTWDNGYPSGGNYWSDYTGTDLYSGPDQNIAGSDFRGDTPYSVNTNNTDHYPLTIPYETQPPTITILSPENKTYTVNTDIPLTFTLDELADWIGYSLNGQPNATIAGNATLPTLPDGWHYLTVYANDTFDNMGMSIVYFTVDTTPPIANAGNDQTVNEDTLATLDGSTSTDENGISAHTWTFTDVTAKTLTGEKPAYTFSNPGVYTITLNVTDAAGHWATDTVAITVLDVTDPVANAGQDQTVNVGATMTFEGGDSTDNVGIVSYEWAFGDETSGTGVTVTHEYTGAGTYTVTLTVEDAAGNQATDTIVVTVNAAEAFPWWIVAAAGIVVVGIAVAALVFWRGRKKA